MKWAQVHQREQKYWMVVSIYTSPVVYIDSFDNIYTVLNGHSKVVKHSLLNGSYTQSVIAGGNGGGSALNELNRPNGFLLMIMEIFI